MTGVVFDALLPDFAVADRPAAPPRQPDFIPLIASDGSVSGQFQTLSGNPSARAAGGPDTVARNAARDAYAQQEQAQPAGGATGPEDELDRQWKAVEQAQEAGILSGLAEKHEAELSSLRAVHAAEIASLTVHAIEEMEKRIAAAVQDHLVSILGTVMSAQHQRRTVQQFAERAAAMATDGRGAQVRVSGPPQLLEALRTELGDKAGRYMLVPADTAELEAAIDETVLSTRFGDWHSALERVLA